ncbi:arginine deiminase family protein [Flammeovirga agarivorans]|uniref:Amidinotransferase n=1 Tax=Flammeovirga agarivorans TaxID=2726742 RepID=A0A7X8SKT9_9BACT|nr:arginine deiminase family protein [Flammeovirga agarivorans]NLR92083.1 hypothetical protein [Flammeovirga agarivorans]
MKKMTKYIYAFLFFAVGLMAFNILAEELKDRSFKSNTIQNNYEWGELKEVVIGRWVPGTLQLPAIDISLRNHFPYISDSAFQYMKKFENKNIEDVYPKDDQEYFDEQEKFVELVKSLGIKVRRPEVIEFETMTTTQNYSRDPIITIGDKMIVANMNTESRRQETGNYRRILLDLAKKYDGNIVNMPPLKAGYHKDNAYLEGGDVFVNGREVYVGISGNASNEKGIEWLRKELGRDYTVHAIKLKKHVLHLDCAMMLINDHQGIICYDDFENIDSLPESLKSYKWVEVSPQQAQRMATNGMVVDPHTVILSDAFPEVSNRVRKLGIKVYETSFRKANYFGGGLRCSYQPIYRNN